MKVTALVLPLLLLVAACGPPPEPFTVTLAPSAGAVPRVLAVHPLLTSVPRTATALRNELRTLNRAGDIAIIPPVETDLKVTLASQMMTERLEADLAYQGFVIKALPVDVFAAQGDGKGGAPFGVSLATLTELRENYGVDALVVGNAYLLADTYAPGEQRVRAAFLKVIELTTLDVLCHASFTPDEGTAEVAWVTARLAEQLDALARPARP